MPSKDKDSEKSAKKDKKDKDKDSKKDKKEKSVDKDSSKSKDDKKKKKDKDSKSITSESIITDLETMSNVSDLSIPYSTKKDKHKEETPEKRNTKDTERTQQQPTQDNFNAPLFYNDTLEELTTDPISSPLYRIISVDEAFRVRSNWINGIINSSLLYKRESLLKQMQNVDNRMEEIKKVRGIIERDIRQEQGGVAERLRNAEGQKVAILMHDMSEIQRDIDRVDNITQTVKDLVDGTQDKPGPYIHEFLTRWKLIQQNSEYSLTKPFKTSIEVYPHDLPRELAEKRLIIDKYNVQNNLLELKDEMIFKLVNERNINHDKEIDQFERNTNVEFQEWAQLTDRYASEVNTFYKLRDMLEGYVKNLGELSQNKHEIKEKDGKKEEVQIPGKKEIPVDDVIKVLRNIITKTKPLSQTNSLKNIGISKVNEKIKEQLKNNNINLIQTFQTYDIEKKGSILSNTFIQILNNTLNKVISKDDVALLAKCYEANKINETDNSQVNQMKFISSLRVDKVMEKLITIINDKKINLNNQFSKSDVKNEGYLLVNTFESILKSSIENALTEDELVIIVSSFEDEGKVSQNTFLESLKNTYEYLLLKENTEGNRQLTN